MNWHDDARAGSTGEEAAADGEGETADHSGAAGAAKVAEVRALIEALPTCVTREQCDTLCMSFVLVHSKGARKRMVRALTLVASSPACPVPICNQMSSDGRARPPDQAIFWHCSRGLLFG